MSILLQTDPQMTSAQWALLSILAGGAVVGAWTVGVFRAGGLVTRRMEPHRRIGPLAAGFLAGAITFFLVQVAYGVYLGASRGTPGHEFSMELLTVSDWLFMATVPQLAGLLAMVACHAIGIGGIGGGLGALGLRARQIPAGALWGVVGTLIILPLIFWFSALVEVFYQWIGYEHPMEHDLLRIMGQTNPQQRVILLLAITVCAPVMEELLFRGQLQTLLRRLMGRWPTLSPHVLPDGSLYLPSPYEATMVTALDYSSPTLPPLDPADAPWTAWVAILVTSGLFAVIHPIWSAPPIFLLSVALGYAYERTANLWVSIAMHMLFNGTSTLLFWITTR